MTRKIHTLRHDDSCQFTAVAYQVSIKSLTLPDTNLNGLQNLLIGCQLIRG